jgi:hypothetical protein
MRKMKKFSEGGNAKYDAKYKRKVADIESDYAKAMKGKTGRAAEIAAAKRDQRLADAKDDLAKWTKSDRTQTRAAEATAERNLTRTRKFGAAKPAAEPAKASTSEPVKAPETKAAAPEKKAEPKSFGEAFRAARASMGAGKTFTWQGKSYSTNRAGEGKSTPKAGAGKPPMGGGAGKPPAPTANTPAKPANTGAFSMLMDTPALSRQRMERARTEARRRNAESDTSKRFAESQKRKYGYAEGGTVKKKSTPPQPTPEERAAAKRQNESLKKAKPTPADASAIGRGNRSSGMNKGGAVKKYAVGGLAKVMPTADQMGSLGMAKGGKAKMADKAGRALKKKSADTMGRAMMKKAGGGKCYAKGGSVSARADGCAVKGKTKGKMI